MADEPAPPAEPTEPVESLPPPSAPEPSPSSAPAEPEAPAEQETPVIAAEVAAVAPQAEPPPIEPAQETATEVLHVSSGQAAPAPSTREERPSRVRIIWSDSDRKASVAERTRRKETHLTAIAQLTRARKRIRNDEVVRKIHVSDASASRYTKTLVERGVLRREGKGRGASYVLL